MFPDRTMAVKSWLKKARNKKKLLLLLEISLLLSYSLVCLTLYPRESRNNFSYLYLVDEEDVDNVTANLSTIESVLRESGYEGIFFFPGSPENDSFHDTGTLVIRFNTSLEEYLTLDLYGYAKDDNFTGIEFRATISNYEISIIPNDARLDHGFDSIKDALEKKMEGISMVLNLTQMVGHELIIKDLDLIDVWFVSCMLCLVQIFLLAVAFEHCRSGNGGKKKGQPVYQPVYSSPSQEENVSEEGPPRKAGEESDK